MPKAHDHESGSQRNREGTLKLSAEVTDAPSVAVVEIRDRELLVGSGQHTADNVIWNSALFGDGAAALQVRACDAYGQVVLKAEQMLTINNQGNTR